jgi:hypothetical protein
MADEWRSGKNFEGSGGGLMEVVTQHLSGGAEENHETVVDTHGVVTEIRSSSSRLQAQSVATTRACLMT